VPHLLFLFPILRGGENTTRLLSSGVKGFGLNTIDLYAIKKVYKTNKHSTKTDVSIIEIYKITSCTIE